MNKRQKLIDQFFNLLVEEKLTKRSKNSLHSYLKFLYKNIDLKKKKIIDIGAGFGLYSLYCACLNADRVVLLEPESEGSKRGNFEKFNLMKKKLNLTNAAFFPETVQSYKSQNEKFDILLLHNSINHLDEAACPFLNSSEAAQNVYKKILKKTSRLAKHGASIIICDCSRNNFFNQIGIKNPFAPTIEWNKHQSPEIWIKLLSEFGFKNPRVKWTAPKPLGSFGRFFLGNKILSYFMQSHFCLTMTKTRSN